MRSFIKAGTAGIISLIIFLLLVVFHLLVIFGVLPGDIVWAGQAGENPYNLIIMEITTIILTILFGMVVLMKLRLLERGKTSKVVNIGIWIIFAYFIANTIGNLSTGISVESMIFGPVSIILALLLLRLAIEKKIE